MSSVLENAAHIKFGYTTPFWMLSMSFGTFRDPNDGIYFISPEHYIGYYMLADRTHRDTILACPNGYLAHLALEKFIDTVDNAISPTWVNGRDNIMRECIKLKYTQNPIFYEVLMRTKSRPLVDSSRPDPYWCDNYGKGQNRHGELLEEFRNKAKARDDLFKTNTIKEDV